MDELGTHKLRRTWFSGYRVADVEVLVAQISLRVSQLASELESATARLAEAEQERRELTRLLGDAHARELELAARASAADAERDEAMREAQARAAEVVDSAHLDAARIRADAALEAERARGQVDELVRLRETLAATIRAATRDVERVLRGEAPPPPEAVPTAAPPASAPVPPFSSMFVEIDAGPFDDVASLSAFEESLGRLPKVERVYIRRFENDRALLEVTLDEPAPLLDEITRRMPYEFSVDHASEGRIALDLAAPQEAR